MVGADQSVAVSFALGEQGTTMSADIRHDPNFPIFTAHCAGGSSHSWKAI